MAGSALLNIRYNHTSLLYQGQSRAWTTAAPCVASQVSLVGKGAKKREVPKALCVCVGVLNACWLVIRSLAAYNYAKLHRWVGVVSRTVWAAPRAEDLLLTWTLLVSQASQAETWKVTCSALLMFRKKI